MKLRLQAKDNKYTLKISVFQYMEAMEIMETLLYSCKLYWIK